MRNPCLNCDEVGVDEDKNHPACKVCPKRDNYAKAIEGMDVFDMDGDAGSLREQIEELDELAEQRFQMIEKEKEMDMTRAEEIEVVIADICEECFTSVESVRDGRRKPEDSKARRKIIERLISDDFKMPQTKIATLLGVSYPAVNLIVTRLRRGKFKEDEPKKSKKERVIFEVDFTDYRDVYDFLIKESAHQFRTPEDHVIFILREARDRGIH